MTSPLGIKPYLRICESRVYFQTRISQCSVKNVELVVPGCRLAATEKMKDYGYELPATWDQRSGSSGSGFVPARDRSGPGAARHPADLERGDGRGRRAHAPAEPLQDRPRRRPL